MRKDDKARLVRKKFENEAKGWRQLSQKGRPEKGPSAKVRPKKEHEKTNRLRESSSQKGHMTKREPNSCSSPEVTNVGKVVDEINASANQKNPINRRKKTEKRKARGAPPLDDNRREPPMRASRFAVRKNKLKSQNGGEDRD